MIQSHPVLVSNLLKIGVLLILLPVGLVFSLYGLHELGLINVWQLPLKFSYLVG